MSENTESYQALTPPCDPAELTDEQKLAIYEGQIVPNAKLLRDICAGIGCQTLLSFELPMERGTQVGQMVAFDAGMASPALAAALALTLTGVPGMEMWQNPPRLEAMVARQRGGMN